MTQAIMSTTSKRMYAPIWEAIKAAPVGEAVAVRVRDATVKTLIQAVKKEKNRDVGVKKKVGMLTAGRMKIAVKPDAAKKGYTVVSFSLEWDGSRL